MTDITVMVSYRSLPNQAQSALRAIETLVATVLAGEPACKGIEILQDDGDPTRIILLERWTSRDEFLGPHMQQPHIQSFIREASSFLGGPPEITFWRSMSPA